MENSTKRYSFPNFEETPESVKNTPGYSIQVAQAVIDRYKSNRTELGISWGTWFSKLRLYGLGRQSPDQYKTFLSGSVSSNTSIDNNSAFDVRKSAQKGWYNIMWDDIVSFIPNLKSQIRGHFTEIDYDVKADNVDVDSGAEEERRMMEVFTNTHPVFGSMINGLKQTVGVPLEEPEYIPEGLQELQDLKDEGGFKPPYTQQHEKLLLHTENISNWDRFLKDQLINDTLDIGYLFAYADFDEETCKPKWHYADPENVIMQYDHDNGFQNSDYAGVKVKMTISQLKQFREHIVDSNGNPITEEGFAKIARNFCKFENNPDEAEWDSYSKNIGLGYGYDDFTVSVFKIWWKDVEYIKRIQFKNKYGKTKLYDYQDPIEGEYDSTGDGMVEYGKNMPGKYSLKVEPIDNVKVTSVNSMANGFKVATNLPGKIKYKAYYNIGKGETIKKVRIRKVYHCWMIDKSDYCIKYGTMPNQLRYEYTEPLLPIVGYRYPDKALTFRCVPIEDIYQIAWYRLQNGLAKAMQGIYAINTTLLGDNGKSLDKIKTLKAIRENQALFYKMGLNGNVGGTPIPISYIPGNLAEVIQNEAAIMNMCMKWVEDQTGFSMIALGATPSPETGLGVTERSMQATQKSIMPIMTAIRYIKEELAKRTSCMWQAAIQNDDKARMEAAKIIGEDGVWILQQAKSSDVQYGVHLVSRPDSDLKAAVLSTVDAAFQSKEITADERLFIIEQVNSGCNLKEMRMKLRKMIMKNKMLNQQLNERNIMIQGQQNEKLAQAQAQSAQQIEAMRIRSKDAEIKTQSMATIAIRDHDSRRKIEEEIAKYQLSIGIIPNNPKPQQPSQQPPQQPVQPPQLQQQP